MHNELERKAIPDLMGRNFFIPDFQRGYRWEELQIHQLLADIWYFVNEKAGGDFYCLQPIVVKECSPEIILKYDLSSDFDENRWYEVIDGQQRLTTIRLIIELNNIISPFSAVTNCFKLFYETRPELCDIFTRFEHKIENQQLEISINRATIDSYYITNGIQIIKNWFTEKGFNFEKRATLQEFGGFFSVFFGQKDGQGKSTQLIWYQVNESVDSKAIFRRLNDTKIPLTNAELIKAMFLSDSSKFSYNTNIVYSDTEKMNFINFEKQKKQNQIAKKWDSIEHNLGNKKFWSFITNKKVDEFSTKIELLFDLISQKHITKSKIEGLNKQDVLYTYLYFDKQIKTGGDLWDLWLTVENYYETLLHWFEDRNLYHKIGYLVSVEGDSVLIKLLRDSTEQSKTSFNKRINIHIQGTLNVDFAKLNYLEYRQETERLLLLHNIETTRRLLTVGFYPFDIHKSKSWSIEHIHAQKSELLSRDDKQSWLNWLSEHITVLQKLMPKLESRDKDELHGIIESLKDSYSNSQIGFPMFLNEYEKVVRFFNKLNQDSEKGDKLHELSNLALLGGVENSVLSSSVFESKRQSIIQMDAEGKYIPICTRYVFLKYYNSKEDNFATQQIYYWGENDRKNYLKHIYEMLLEYFENDKIKPILNNFEDDTTE